ncbi:Nucleotide-diphospho-sugar transferase domain-containing protein [Caenorhabditis elegans]|uniref:Nucleotide-diphospho-sugar transferase domain-containing protein n=1 Tax=Caenorhabditis elegans TaxID=6239 RepID=G5EES4_CAEEL|nr:Nucleotide-diphospho-sugar transferase domain-containing protein [Caenorhabditis elegans]CAH60774.1 Nucleotide-diphospho-sugar transferase domain-containing protein [Caenorhabditis elegans]|eukprot:NP_001021442.1 Uncharacterized protein CELE_F32H2.11 [Caenorhabditis elegans]
MARVHYKIRHCCLFFLLLFSICLFTRLIFDDIQYVPISERFPISRATSYRHLNISVVIIVGNITSTSDYKTALNSIRCYCKMHDYPFFLIQDTDYHNVCNQKDFMFRRHCIVAHLLEKSQWLLFLDADIAVVNPDVLIEEYINPHYDLTFYDRFINWEVAAGSYIVRNTHWAKTFLLQFADFESELPNSFHGTDNGALHIFLQQSFYPQLSEESKVCRKIWEQAQNFKDLFTFEACIRTVMGDVHEFDRARILKKGTGWVRDIWLTDSKWSPERDFMLHGLKDSNEVVLQQGFLINTIYGVFNWRSPFASNLNLKRCEYSSYSQWKMKEHLMVSSREIEDYLSRRFDEVERRRWESLAYVATYI